MGEVLTVLPFSNTLATFQLSGADVVASLENGVSQIEDGGRPLPAGRRPQIYLRPASRPAPRQRRAGHGRRRTGCRSTRPRPTASSPTTTCAAAATATSFRPKAENAYDFGPPLEEVLADYIAKQGGTYTPYTDGRITDASPAPQQLRQPKHADGAAATGNPRSLRLLPGSGELPGTLRPRPLRQLLRRDPRGSAAPATSTACLRLRPSAGSARLLLRLGSPRLRRHDAPASPTRLHSGDRRSFPGSRSLSGQVHKRPMRVQHTDRRFSRSNSTTLSSP